jgi:hypothetical protein
LKGAEQFSIPVTLPGKQSRQGRACSGKTHVKGESVMSTKETTKYFDLHTQGLGYLNRIREVTPKEGEPFVSVVLSALRGSVDNVQYTLFECRVSGKKAQEIVQRLKPAVEGESKVLLGFTLSDLYSEIFTFKKGDHAGETGVSLKARLLRIAWVKVDGQPFYSAQEDAA